MSDGTPSRRDVLLAVGAAGGAAAVHAATEALGLMPAIATAQPLELAPARQGGLHVVVLGAGVGGLAAAYELRKAGHRCTVLEASPRAGGRNLTVRGGDVIDELGGRQVCEFDDHPDLYFNAGPARIPGHHTALLGYCREFGVALEFFVNENRNAWVQDDAGFDGKPVRNREYMTDARGFMAELLAKAVDAKALTAPFTADDGERLREFARAYGDLGAGFAYQGSKRAGFASGGNVMAGINKAPLDASHLLATSFWREFMHWGEFVDQASPMMQPVGGMDRIVTAFMERVGDAVQLASPVQEIRLLEDGVAIAYADARGEPRSLTADYCLNSIPTHLVTGLAHNFPAAYVRALSAPARGKLMKIAFQTRRRFWEDEGIYGGISWTSQDITQIWYPPQGIHSEKGVILGAYVFDDDVGARLARLTPAERLATAIRQGEKIHPSYRSHLESGVSVAWSRMNHMLGCAATWSPEALREHFPTLQRPVGRHYMIGDQVSHRAGWQEGAIASAHLALTDIDAREREARVAA